MLRSKVIVVALLSSASATLVVFLVLRTRIKMKKKKTGMDGREFMSKVRSGKIRHPLGDSDVRKISEVANTREYLSPETVEARRLAEEERKNKWIYIPTKTGKEVD